MQLTFQFAAWQLSAGQGIVGRQYDNLSHSLVVVGDLPAGYTWDMLVEARGKYNVIPLSLTDTGVSAVLTADQLAFGDTYYAFQLRGTSGEIIHHTNAVQVYVPDTIVGPGTWPVLPTEFSQAEANIKELNAHPPVPGENGYYLLWDLDTHSYVQSQMAVPGLHIEIGETTTGEPGTPASVTNSGTDTAPVLDFTIPEGEKGDAATIQVGKVTASDPGSEPKVTNSGTENAAVFDFVLPRGQTGPTGQAATIEVASTATGEPGTQASVENVGTTGAAKLKFTIPRGNTGQNGVTPTLSAGDVETLEPDQPATASVTGEGPAYQINLGIPRGKTGAQGTPGQNGQDGQTPTIAVGTVTTLDPGQDATAEITGETPNLTLNLGIPEGQPGQDGVQLNDYATNTTEAWSSKKIVDTLCPSFSVSGNPVTFNPMEDYPLSAVVTLEPKQAGTGDPSPENVRPISGYDGVTVNVRGKNLLGISLPYSITLDPSTNFSLDLNLTGTFVFHAQIDYTDQGKVSTALFSYVVNGSTKYISADNSNSEHVISGHLSKLSLINWSQSTGTINKIQLELGSTPTPYEPYQPGTTATLTLPETIYGGTVDAVTGVGSEEWSPVIDLDATLPIGYLDEFSNDTTCLFYIKKITNQGDYLSICCSHSPTKKSITNVASTEIGICGNPPGNLLYLRLPRTTASNISEFGEWLDEQKTAGTPVQVAYKLATPEPFQASGNQPLPAVAGLNTVYTDGDSLSVSGRQDLLYTLQTMQAQTTNLNRFIAEGGAING